MSEAVKGHVRDRLTTCLSPRLVSDRSPQGVGNGETRSRVRSEDRMIRTKGMRDERLDKRPTDRT